MIVFDFDGVIADSREAMLAAFRALAQERGVAPLSEAEYAALSARALLQRFKVRWFQVPYYVRRARRMMRDQAPQLRLHPEVQPALAWIRREGVPVAILSSNGDEIIRAFVRTHLPEVPFAEVIGGAGLFHKHRPLKRLLARHRLRGEQLVYVGDQVADMEAARRVGALPVGVCWGKDTRANLEATGPAACCDDGEALLAALQDLSATASAR